MFIITNVQKVKYGKLPAKATEEIARNKLFVYLIYHMNILKPRVS